MSALLRDLRYGARFLARNPGFTAIVVVTLALGIGANSAIFSVVNGILWEPMPYKNPDRLIRIFERNPKDRAGNYRLVSIPNFEDFSDRSRVLEDMARLQPYKGPFTLTLHTGGQPQEIPSFPMTASLFRVLGVEPILGRTFTEEEEVPGKNRVVVLSYRFWQRHLEGDRDVIGEEITLSGKKYVIVGVMPQGFEFPPFEQPRANQRELWVPAFTDPASTTDRAWRGEQVYGRLKPGVTAEQAEAELNTVCRQLGEVYPATNEGWRAMVVPMHSRFLSRSRERPVLLFLLGAVGFVLLIGCANIASLVMARAEARETELAVRSALGAGPARIARQLLTESVLAALLGGSVGLVLAFAGLRAFKDLLPRTLPRVDSLSINTDVLLFTLGVTVLTGLLFGAAPALRAARTDLFQTLKLEKTARPSTRHLGGNILIVFEIALSLILLIGAGLMLRSFSRILEDDFGFRTERVLTIRTLLPEAEYGQPGRARRFHRDLLEKVRHLPGVEVAGLVSTLPLHASGFSTRARFAIQGRPEGDHRDWPQAHYKVVSPGFFQSIDIPLAMGRKITERDDQAAPPVLVISESMANEHWPGENPLGKRIKIRWPGGKVGPWSTVVGVVRDIKLSLDNSSEPIFYVPYQQLPDSDEISYHTYFMNLRWSNIVARTATEPASLVPVAQQQVWELDPAQPVEVASMRQVIAETVAPHQFSTLLTASFSGLALLLASAGIYGVISYSVTRRTREIGVRVALGAHRWDVLKLVLRHGLLLTLLGLAIGWVAALALAKYIQSQLYGVSPTDLGVYLVVSLILFVVALLACYFPARRAAHVEPVVALRQE